MPGYLERYTQDMQNNFLRSGEMLFAGVFDIAAGPAKIVAGTGQGVVRFVTCSNKKPDDLSAIISDALGDDEFKASAPVITCQPGPAATIGDGILSTIGIGIRIPFGVAGVVLSPFYSFVTAVPNEAELQQESARAEQALDQAKQERATAEQAQLQLSQSKLAQRAAEEKIQQEAKRADEATERATLAEQARVIAMEQATRDRATAELALQQLSQAKQAQQIAEEKIHALEQARRTAEHAYQKAAEKTRAAEEKNQHIEMTIAVRGSYREMGVAFIKAKLDGKLPVFYQTYKIDPSQWHQLHTEAFVDGAIKAMRDTVKYLRRTDKETADIISERIELIEDQRESFIQNPRLLMSLDLSLTSPSPNSTKELSANNDRSQVVVSSSVSSNLSSLLRQETNEEKNIPVGGKAVVIRNDIPSESNSRASFFSRIASSLYSAAPQPARASSQQETPSVKPLPKAQL